MNSAELIKASLKFENDGRMPYDFIHSEKPDEILLNSDLAQPHPRIMENPDFISPPSEELQKFVPRFNGELRMDEWGVIHGRLMNDKLTQGEPVWFPIQNWERDFENWKAPDFSDPRRFQRGTKIFDQPENASKFKLLYVGPFMYSLLRNVRGMEEASCDIASTPEVVEAFNVRLLPIYLKMIEESAKTGADAVFFNEDLGTQTALLMSPKSWRNLYAPYWEEVCARARKLKMSVFLHSCGNNRLIISDLIRAGVAALNFDQQQVYGLDYLAENFGGKVSFFNPVDIQATMPKGDKEAIRAEACQMINYHRRFRGGMIAKDYYGWNAVFVTRESAETAREVFRKQE